MKSWKSSQFNTFINVNDGCVIRNLFSNEYLYVKKSEIEIINRLCSNEDIFLDPAILNILIKLGMVVEKNVIEYKKVDEYREKIATSNDRLDITIMPTLDCNFKCAYCFENERTKYMTHESAEALVKYFDSSFKKYKSVYIQWFGGEPLLCKDMINYIMSNAIRIAKREKLALISGITTNGYELNLETYKMLCENRITWIQLSVDGMKETHNSQRPHKSDLDSYTKIITNLKNIRDCVPSGICKIYFRVTISKSILNEIDNILMFYKNEFSSDKRFMLSLQPVMDWGGERIDNMMSELPNVKDTVDCLMKASKLGLMPIGHHTQASSGLICEAVRKNGFVIDPHMDVYKCPMAMYSKEKDDLYRGKVGYISMQGNIIINDNYNLEWMKGGPYKGEICHRCTYYAICHGNVTCAYSSKFCNEQKNLCRKLIYDEYIPAETLMQYELNKIKNVYKGE